MNTFHRGSRKTRMSGGKGGGTVFLKKGRVPMQKPQTEIVGRGGGRPSKLKESLKEEVRRPVNKNVKKAQG